MTDRYKIWKPKHDGHAPPNWKEGMAGAVDLNPDCAPMWHEGSSYAVPAEALNSPNDDVMDAKPTDPRKSVHEALAILRGYSADELAKHGITLAEPKDWATELWGEIYQAWHIGGDEAAADHIRTRFEQMKGEG